MAQRASTRVFTGLAARAIQRGVHVHGKVVALLARDDQRFDEARVVPRGEYFRAPFVITEDLWPGARGLPPVFLPALSQFGLQLLAARLQPAQAVSGYWAG